MSFRVFQNLQQAHSALFRAADKVLRAKQGLTASQQAILFLLKSKGPMPSTDIASALSMGNSSVTGLVDRMIAKGFVSRCTSQSDGRVTLISLEDQGAALCDAALPMVSNINGALLAPFSEPEQQTIKAFLDHVRENAADITENAAQPEATQRKVS